MIIGPEGGFSDLEIKSLINKGFKPVALGTKNLRAKTVVLYAISVINYQKLEE